jgi:hypothetical protein
MFHFESNQAVIGGPDMIVEIDETMIVMRSTTKEECSVLAGYLVVSSGGLIEGTREGRNWD